MMMIVMDSDHGDGDEHDAMAFGQTRQRDDDAHDDGDDDDQRYRCQACKTTMQ